MKKLVAAFGLALIAAVLPFGFSAPAQAEGALAKIHSRWPAAGWQHGRHYRSDKSPIPRKKVKV
jgi:hypothetical protein